MAAVAVAVVVVVVGTTGRNVGGLELSVGRMKEITQHDTRQTASNHFF